MALKRVDDSRELSPKQIMRFDINPTMKPMLAAIEPEAARELAEAADLPNCASMDCSNLLPPLKPRASRKTDLCTSCYKEHRRYNEQLRNITKNHKKSKTIRPATITDKPLQQPPRRSAAIIDEPLQQPLRRSTRTASLQPAALQPAAAQPAAVTTDEQWCAKIDAYLVFQDRSVIASMLGLSVNSFMEHIVRLGYQDRLQTHHLCTVDIRKQSNLLRFPDQFTFGGVDHSLNQYTRGWIKKTAAA